MSLQITWRKPNITFYLMRKVALYNLLLYAYKQRTTLNIGGSKLEFVRNMCAGQNKDGRNFAHFPLHFRVAERT